MNMQFSENLISVWLVMPQRERETLLQVISRPNDTGVSFTTRGKKYIYIQKKLKIKKKNENVIK